MRILIRNTAFVLASFRICDCGLGHQGNLRICGLIITNSQICDLRTDLWHTSEIYGSTIAEWAQESADLRFADQLKNLRAHLCLWPMRMERQVSRVHPLPTLSALTVPSMPHHYFKGPPDTRHPPPLYHRYCKYGAKLLPPPFIKIHCP
jgi:hypothetical protein